MPQVSDYTALLSGYTLTGRTGAPTFISFSFPTGVPDYLVGVYPEAGLATFRTMTEAEQANARAALALIGDACGITFLEVAPGDADINFMVFDLALMGNATAAGFAYYPGNEWGGGDGYLSDVFMHHNWAGNMHVLLHEIGHAVGLKHTFEGDVTLLPAYDNFQYSMMSYTSGGVPGDVLGSLDDDALRYLYGDSASDGSQVASWSWNAAARILTQTGSESGESIFGMGGSDAIQAAGGADEIYGRGGNDILDGGLGNDYIDGGSGSDTLFGNGGDDEIDGGSGNDSLHGGIGHDLLDGGLGNDTLNGEEGDDELSAWAGNDTLNGGDGHDYLSAQGGQHTLLGGAGDDSISLWVSGSFLSTIDGGAGSDTLWLTFEDEISRSFVTSQLPIAGIERLNMYLGDGADSIFADAANTTWIYGYGGNDTIRFGAATGGAYGGLGNDVLIAGSGFTFLYGGEGADRFVFETVNSSSSASGMDQIEDFQASFDIIDITGLNASSITLGGGGSYLYATTTAGQFVLYIRSAITLNDVLASNKLGGDSADTLIGTVARDILNGGGGNDILQGGASNDSLTGGLGDDVLAGGDGNDELLGGEGSDTADYASASAAVTVDLAGMWSSGGAGNDALSSIENLTGSSFADTLFGNSSVNILNGGQGADNLYGRAGNDVYLVDNSSDRPVELTGEGWDTVYVSVSYTLAAGTEIEHLAANSSAGTAALSITGNELGQIIVGNAGANALYGLAGNDTLRGAGGNDSLNGGEGYDVAVLDSFLRNSTLTVGTTVSIIGPEGTDTATLVEEFSFIDGLYVIDANSAGAQIMRLYSVVFDREVDAAGLDYWVDQAEDAGLSLAQVAGYLASSAEFQTLTGGLTNAGFVDYVYQHALGRAADAEGRAYWVGRLDSGMSRGEMLVGFSESAEHFQLSADIVAEGYFQTDDTYQAIALLYDTFAGRLPDQEGLQYWAEMVQSGTMTLYQVAAGFAASSEFQQLTGGMTAAELVDFMYQNTLDRAADESGREYWVDQIESGSGLIQFLLSFSQSAEHATVFQPYIVGGIDYFG